MGQYWVYVVDNPQRDLTSLCWWAFESDFHKGDKICLLPKDEVRAEYFSVQKPDVIVWNYARRNNIKAIKVAHELGIMNIIHDTEGIPHDLSTYFNGITENDLKFIDQIWCWGVNQALFLQERFININNRLNLIITGSIRYEYAKSIPKIKFTNNLDKLIWNTSFCTISPRFQSAWREFTQHHEYLELSSEETLDKFIKFASDRQSSAEYVRILLLYSKCLNITLRPHPFESDSYYLNSFKDFTSKVKFSTSGDINIDLSNHSLVIQYGCQTALDSFIRGIPSVKPCRDNINLWSKVTPYVDPITLCEKISDIDYLQEILDLQKDLFAKHNINKFLYNIDQPFLLNESNNFTSDIRKLPFKAKEINHEIKYLTVNVKSFLKKLLRLQQSDGQSRSLKSSDIKEFMEYNYKNKDWQFRYGKCILKRK